MARSLTMAAQRVRAAVVRIGGLAAAAMLLVTPAFA